MVSGVDEYFQQERSCMDSLVVLLDVVEGVAATAGEGQSFERLSSFHTKTSVGVFGTCPPPVSPVAVM